MTQIDELHYRITAALDRVSQGVEKIETQAAAAAAAPPEPQIDPQEIDRLKEALSEEQLANAQLEERVRRLHETHQQELDAAREEVARATAPAPAVDVAGLDQEMNRLRQANEMLRTTNEELRTALAESVGEPHLINKAMLAELEGLRAARAVETAETQAILGALEPLLQSAADAQEAN